MPDLYGRVFQIGSGILLLLVGSRLIAMEYSSGTIHIAYARGVGRLQLLLGKLTLLVIIAIVLLAGYLVVVGGIVAALYASWTGASRASTRWATTSGETSSIGFWSKG